MNLREINWDQYQSFLAVIDTGSLSGAARQLGMSQPTIGRHIDVLEQRIGATLFVRSRHGLSPTDAAQNMIVHAQSMATAAAAIKRAATSTDDVQGTIRLTASEIIGVEVLPEIIAKFNRKYPLIHIELAITNRTENLLKREADIAIRMNRPVQEALVMRKMGDVPIRLYAHRSYIDEHGTPDDIETFDNHASIGPESRNYYDTYAGMIDVEQLRSAMTFKSDSDLAQLAMVRAGCGIGGVQIQLAARDPELVPILPEQFSIPMEMWLVSHGDTINTRIIRLLFDHLAKHLARYANQ